jgi:hypothetical protein
MFIYLFTEAEVQKIRCDTTGIHQFAAAARALHEGLVNFGSGRDGHPDLYELQQLYYELGRTARGLSPVAHGIIRRKSPAVHCSQFICSGASGPSVFQLVERPGLFYRLVALADELEKLIEKPQE